MEEITQLKVYLLESLNKFLETLAAYLPNILSAIILIILGIVLAWICRWIILRLGVGIDRLVSAVGISAAQVRLRWPVAVILGSVVYWVIILLFLRAALASLKLPFIVDLLGRLITHLPNLLIAALFITAGIFFGNLFKYKITEGARSAGIRQAADLGNLVRLTLIVLSVVAGLAQIGLDVRLFEQILTIVIAALAGAIALAFGLGAGSTVSNIISSRYVRKNYQEGQQIRIKDMTGEILEILPNGVILETKEGRTFIPAKLFDEEASVLLDNESL
ncbi:MAG TPA: hypothetical protein VIV20_09370 [Gammaproteobacteria bacterium]|jgi:small-conductance mechanosensitive channel